MKNASFLDLPNGRQRLTSLSIGRFRFLTSSSTLSRFFTGFDFERYIQISIKRLRQPERLFRTAMATNENLPPNVIKQLLKELKSLDETPPEGIKVYVNEDDFSTIFADIEGPAGTPYENGLFRMKLILAHDFPRSPPKGYFLTNIFHPNISNHGEICVNTLKKDWNPSLGLRHVLTVVRCLLIEPFPESALNETAGKMLIENYEEYAKHARLYTGIHAKPKLKVKLAGISESTTVLNAGQPNSAPVSADQDKLIHITLPMSSATASSIPAPLHKKDTAGPVKIAADKKKVDARKKSLRRL